MNFNDVFFDFEMLRWAVTAALGIYAWFVGKQSASNKEMADIRLRIIKLETDMLQVPTQSQLHELALQMRALSGNVQALAERIEPVRLTVARIDDYLLKHK